MPCPLPTVLTLRPPVFCLLFLAAPVASCCDLEAKSLLALYSIDTGLSLLSVLQYATLGPFLSLYQYGSSVNPLLRLYKSPIPPVFVKNHHTFCDTFSIRLSGTSHSFESFTTTFTLYSKKER